MLDPFTSEKSLYSWQEQLKRALKTQEDFESYFNLTQNEKEAFKEGSHLFNIQSTPYYASLADPVNLKDPIRKMILPQREELDSEAFFQDDPLGENQNRPAKRVIHRYRDRVLFLITDTCGIYCRYCTRKHFTAQGQALPSRNEYQEALSYIQSKSEIKEVILSGGDPLTLSNAKLDKVLFDLEQIPHVELIRLGSRMPAACPMRLDEDLKKVLKRKKPVYLMSHFNHHQELAEYTQEQLLNFSTSGIPILNQMVLLNGVNNSEVLIYKLSRELLKLRVYPYYMFQCDPSPGTSHLQISIEESLQIQKKLWGRSSGLALPTYSVDIPSGGGKAYLTPDFIKSKSDELYTFKGFDGVEAEYKNTKYKSISPYVEPDLQEEWERESL